MTETTATEPSTGDHPFQAEVARLLHLMVHSVYSNKDIFLRELISNSADACEKLRYLAVQDASLFGDDPDLRIRLSADAAAKTLTIADNGIGMDKTELVTNLGTIAHSGTRAFLDSLDEATDGSALIGQFGIGFYSAFMVASAVDVYSTKAGTDETWHWRSDGAGTFSITIETDNPVSRGTKVVLHLRDDCGDYAEEATIERIVRDYSAHVPVPIELKQSDADAWRELADGNALWTRSKSDISEEEYKEFYGHVGGQFDDPALTIHYRAEGRQEYSVLAFIPTMRPFDLFDPDRKGRMKLYVRRVFITDEVSLLPAWLRFVRGLVDSEDLPLNMSRELLQASPLLEAIKKGVTNRILTELGKLADKDTDAYRTFWEAFGAVLKEGLYEDMERRDTLFGLARFRTANHGDDWRTLSDYVADLKDNQTAIHYILADTLEAARSSPHLEGFKARNIDVLLLTDPVDAFWVQTALGFDGKPFRSVTQGAADLDDIPLPEDDTADDEQVRDADLATLIAHFKQALGDKVGDVRASTRLAESPVCLVASDLGPDRQLEKIMARNQGDQPLSAPILELNPKHALVRRLSERASGGADAMEDAAILLFGQARIADGEAPDDPAGFARAMARLMEQALS